MHSLPLSSLGRILLAAGCVGLGTSSLLAQSSSSASSSSASSSSASSTPSAPSSSNVPASKIDIFTGYSYLDPHGSVTVPGGSTIGVNGPVPYTAINVGAIGSVNYFFNRYFGGQFEMGAHPSGPNDGAYTFSGGPVVRFPTTSMTPFLHADVGTVRLGGPFHEPYKMGVALTAGGGMDYPLPFFHGHMGLRLFQADYEYMHVDFGPQPPFPEGGRANVNAVRLSSGLLWHVGSIVPPPPVAFSCTASPSSIYPGDPVTVTGTATNLNPKKTATYKWTTTSGAKLSGDNSVSQVDTSSLNPGNYTVSGHVSEGQKAGQSADCTANLTVKPFEPPTISCSANPSTVQPGGTATITAQGVSPQNRTLTYNYSASSGEISGTGTTATLNTSGAPAGPITVTCNVQDDKGQTASSTSTVTVEAPPPPPPAPATKQLCSISFTNDPRRPGRVDNEAKACLDDVALNMQQQSDASLVVVGEAASNEKHADMLAAQRAVNTKDYLVKEKGIDPSRISVRTGTQGNKEVENYLVPSGANFEHDVQGTTQVDESAVKPQARTGHARKAHHKKAAAQQ